MGSSVEVNNSNFATDVVETSYQRPVLIDFFAQWCGPCQMLKPVLERLAQEYDFTLAKVDIDQSPDLARTYGVEGVPDVRIVTQGQVHPGFVGMLPEPQVRSLLAQLNLQSGLEAGLSAAQMAVAAGDMGDAYLMFTELLEKYPQSHQLAVTAAQFMIRQGELAVAEALLNSVPESDRLYFASAKALKSLLQLQQEGQTTDRTDELAQPFFEAVNQAIAGDYDQALPGLLQIVSQNRKYRHDGARKTMILIFELLGDEHPLAKQYRKQLTLTLY